MTIGSLPRVARGALATIVLAALPAAAPAALTGQTAPEQSFLRALADHHELSADEVGILAEWRIPIGEIPVALAIAGRAGVSPDALAASRRNGSDWATLAGRYGLDLRFFHIEFATVPEPLAALYAELEARPRERWSEVVLQDSHVTFLVNVRFLHEYVGVSPSEAAAALVTHGSPPEALRAISL